MLKAIFAYIKLFFFFMLVISYFTVGAFIYPFFLWSQYYFRKYLLINSHYHAKLLSWLLGIQLDYQQDQSKLKERGELIVSNHLSYLDVIALFATRPACFVTSMEIKETPFLGHICTMAGCLFVERRNKKNIDLEIMEITNTLLNGEDVFVFPEATSTNGHEVIRFKRPLFKAVKNAKTRVKPLCLNYQAIDGQKVTTQNRDLVFWYGDMTFLDHFINVLKHRSIFIRVESMDTISHDFTEDHGQLATYAHESVKSVYKPIRSWVNQYVSATGLSS